MNESVVAVIIFVCLSAISLGSLVISHRLPSRHRGDETLNVVRLSANIFVVMTSLVLGLMISSAKNTLESVDRNIHAFAADLIVLNRSLQHYAADAGVARQRLLAYAQHAGRMIQDEQAMIADREAENLLNAVAASLQALNPQNVEHHAVLQSAQQQFLRLVELHWFIVGQSRGTIPAPLVVMVVAGLMLVFASYGLGAPSNALAVASHFSCTTCNTDRGNRGMVGIHVYVGSDINTHPERTPYSPWATASTSPGWSRRRSWRPSDHAWCGGVCRCGRSHAGRSTPSPKV